MGRYSQYGQELDKIARKTFADFQEAEKEYREARAERGKHPIRHGWGITPDEELAAKLADAIFRKAEERFRAQKKQFEVTMRGVKSLRAKLEKEVIEDLMADPAQMDQKTIDMLNTGICRPEEIRAAYDKAAEAGNVLMMRWIGQFAADEARKTETKPEARAVLSQIASEGKNADIREKSGTLAGFDTMVDVLQRFGHNPRMADHWDELTADVKESL